MRKPEDWEQLSLPLPEPWEIPVDRNPDLTPEECGVPAASDARSAPSPEAAPSLDTKCQNPTKQENDHSPQQEDEGLRNPKREEPNPEVEGTVKPRWDRKQKRAYHKSLTLMKYWEACGYQVFFVTLTGAATSDAKQLSYHHERLKMAVVRSYGLVGMEHFKVITIEGHGVIHALWAVPPAKHGFRDSAVFIPQRWLSSEWERIHGAKVVDIRRVTIGASSQRRLSRYIVSQYCGGQSGFVRSDYTHPKWLGFSIRSTWLRLKREWRSIKPICSLHFGSLCDAWDSLIRVRSCWLGKYQFVVCDAQLVEV